MAIIEMVDITKSYNNRKILNGFSIVVNEGEMIAITGVSGKGKSTILNIIGLLEDYDCGYLKIDGDENIRISSKKAMKILRDKIGYLFQNFALIEDKSVYKNLELALEYVNGTKESKKLAIKEVLERVELKDIDQKKVFELSGGEQQRVALARLMLKPCKIILADEPTGSLDTVNKNKVIDILKLLNSEGKTIVIVTHDNEVANSCNRTINL